MISALDTKLTQIAAHQDQQKLDTDVFVAQRNQMLYEVAVQKRLSKRSGTGGGMTDISSTGGERGGGMHVEEMDVDISGTIQQPGGGGLGSTLLGLIDRKKK